MLQAGDGRSDFLTPPYHGKEAMITNKTYANPYKLARQAAGLTRAQAAERLHIDDRTLYNYENGIRMPSHELRTAMAKTYDMPQLVIDPGSPTSATAVFLKELEDVGDIRREVMEITYDNVISPDEGKRWNEICAEVQELAMACMALGSVR